MPSSSKHQEAIPNDKSAATADEDLPVTSELDPPQAALSAMPRSESNSPFPHSTYLSPF